MDTCQGSIRSVRLRAYMRTFEHLDRKTQARIDATYENYFRHDPFHPNLRPSWYKDKQDDRRVLRVALPRYYRALAYYEESTDPQTGEPIQTFLWWWVGNHESYNNFKAQRIASASAS